MTVLFFMPSNDKMQSNKFEKINKMLVEKHFIEPYNISEVHCSADFILFYTKSLHLNKQLGGYFQLKFNKKGLKGHFTFKVFKSKNCNLSKLKYNFLS